MSYYFEPPSVALAAPPAVAGDLIVGRADGNFDRLAIGAAGQMLSVVAGSVTWGEGPLTTIGDLLIGSTAGSAPTRLAIGAAGQMLSVVAGSVTWGEGPLTTIGDLLIGSTAGSAPTRLGIGANGSLLNVSGGAIRWGNTIDTGGLTITAGNLVVTAGSATIGSTLTVQGASASFGTNPATASGILLIPNNSGGLTGRNAANTGNVPLIDVDGANIIQIAPFGQAVTVSGNTTFAGLVGNTTFSGFIVVGTTVTVGTTPAATGAVRLPNATGNGANFRNAAGTADIIGIELDNADHLRVGAEVVGLGAGAVCVLSNAGAPGPTANGQAAWVKVVARNGTLYWVPVWV